MVAGEAEEDRISEVETYVEMLPIREFAEGQLSLAELRTPVAQGMETETKNLKKIRIN